MGLLYAIQHWLDHVTEYPGRRIPHENPDGTVDFERAEGKILQQGTGRNATKYNNMETGILAANIASTWLWTLVLQHRRKLNDLSGEYGEITLANTKQYPFSNAAKTISMAERRTSMAYHVSIEIVSVTAGFVESVEVYDRQLNGFKIRYTGSARSATIKYCVMGGKVS